MFCICIRVCFVSRCLSCLCQQDKRCSVGCLKTECEIQKNKRVGVKLGKTKDVGSNPYCNNGGLYPQKNRCSEEPCERFGLERKSLVAESWGKVIVSAMKTQVVDA